MSGHAVKKIDDMEAVYGGAFKRVRAELGVESFGIGIIDLPPNFEGYPDHDHAQDGQEEVYFTLRGGGEIEIEGERFPLDEDHAARVGPGVSRKVWPGDDGIRILDHRRQGRRALRGARRQRARQPGPDERRTTRRRPCSSALAPVTRLVAGAGGDRDPRVARVCRVGPRAQAEREDRAARVGHELLVAAAVAEPGRGRAGPPLTARAGRRRCTPRAGRRSRPRAPRRCRHPRRKSPSRVRNHSSVRPRRRRQPANTGARRSPGFHIWCTWPRPISISSPAAQLALLAIDPGRDRPPRGPRSARPGRDGSAAGGGEPPGR